MPVGLYAPHAWAFTQGKTIYVNGVPGARWPQIQQGLTNGNHVTTRALDPKVSPQFVAAEAAVSKTLSNEVGTLERQFASRYRSLLNDPDKVTAAMGRMLGNLQTRSKAVNLASKKLGVKIELEGATSWTSQEGWAKTLPKTSKNQPAVMELAQKKGPIRTRAVEIARTRHGNGIDYRVYHQEGSLKGACHIRVEAHGDAVSVKVVSGHATKETMGRILSELQQVLRRLGIRPTVVSGAAPKMRSGPRYPSPRGHGGMRTVFRSLGIFQVFSIVFATLADAKDAKDPAQVRAVAEAVQRGEIELASLYLSPLWGPVNEYLKKHPGGPMA